MNIDETINELERLIDEKKDLKELSPKDRLNFWASMMEFKTPKIQRSVYEPINQDDFKIMIERYESNKTETHESISQSLGGSKREKASPTKTK